MKAGTLAIVRPGKGSAEKREGDQERFGILVSIGNGDASTESESVNSGILPIRSKT
jgi:hypothetical protein